MSKFLSFLEIFSKIILTRLYSLQIVLKNFLSSLSNFLKFVIIFQKFIVNLLRILKHSRFSKSL